MRGVADPADRPRPHEMSTQTDADASTDHKLTCPVPGCSYSHPSANGIISHVGNGHPDGWDAAEATPRDVHQAATQRDEAAMIRVVKVENYLARHGVDLGAVRVYQHQGYGNIQIAREGYLDDWDAFMDAVREPDGVRYNGDVNWCTEEFVEQLPDPGKGSGGKA